MTKIKEKSPLDKELLQLKNTIKKQRGEIFRLKKVIGHLSGNINLKEKKKEIVQRQDNLLKNSKREKSKFLRMNSIAEQTFIKNQTAEEYTKNKIIYLESIINCMPGNVYWMNKNCVYLGCNDNVAKLLGLKSRKEIIGKSYKDFEKIGNWKEGQVESFMKDDLEVIANGFPKYNVEEPPLYDPQGNLIRYLTTRVPMKDLEGNVIGVVGVSIDITDRKRMEQELKEAKEKAEAANEIIKIFAASIAHELRTPLASISGNVYGIIKYLPLLVEAYQKANEAGLPIPKIRPSHYQSLKSLSNNIESEIEYAKIVIDMLLMKTNAQVNQNIDFKLCSIKKCLKKALLRYPFKSDKERNLIRFNLTKDFLFCGTELFVIHVLFNLIKNALYYLEAAGKGGVNIWLGKKKTYNYLYFCDTGKGIKKEILPHIFDSYFSQTLHGTGIGLAFCKQVMRNLSGDIECESIEGEYTKFILKFPIVAKK